MLVEQVAQFREEDVMEDASYQDFLEPPAPEMWRWTKMKIKHIYEKLGAPDMWRCPLASFLAVLLHICYELDLLPWFWRIIVTIVDRMSEERLNKAYPCQYCGMSFAQNWLLKRSHLDRWSCLDLLCPPSTLSGTGRPTRATSRSSAPSALAHSPCATPVFAIFALSTRNW